MNFITWSFSKDVLLTPAYSTWSRVECVLCRSWAGSFNFPLLRVSDLLPCCSNSDLTTTCSDVLFSAPNSKFGWSSDKGKDFIGLLVTSLEEDHSSAVPRLTLPNIGSSLLQNITCEDIESDGIHWKHYCKTKKKKSNTIWKIFKNHTISGDNNGVGTCLKLWMCFSQKDKLLGYESDCVSLAIKTLQNHGLCYTLQ